MGENQRLDRSITKNLDDHDEKYMKIKLDSSDKLPPNKTIEIPTITIVASAVFLQSNKYYAQFFLNECLHKK